MLWLLFWVCPLGRSQRGGNADHEGSEGQMDPQARQAPRDRQAPQAPRG